MNQLKIGKFIAECRKQKNLTQLELALKLGITDKAISKWERAIAMPDTSIMIELCDILGISVNELLRGERMMNNVIESNEKILLDMAKEIERKNKMVLSSMWTIIIISTISLLAGVAAVLFCVPKGVWQIIAIIGLVLVFIIPCLYAIKLETVTGVYRCKNCGNEIVPNYSKVMWSMHIGTTRHLKCPKCNKHSWCKKVINK